MRKILFAAIIFISVFTNAFGQHALSESRRSSSELFVYKLAPKDVRDLYLKGKELEESMLHTFILSCADRKDIPPLPRGNYITVKVVDNELVYSDHTVDDFYYSTVKDEKVTLFLSDTLGNVIDDAIVRRGLKRLRFDNTTQTYVTRYIGDEKIAEVDHNGVLHYIEFSKEYYHRNNLFKKAWWKFQNTFNRVFAPERAPARNKYDGFVVFSKPKYKPGETVRFKAYINNNGRPYNEEAEISLFSYYPHKMDTILTTLQPYRPGMYEWQFNLSDRLKLRLDNDYKIVLRTKGNRTNDMRGSFRYEEYELGRITFEAEAVGGAKYVKGDTVKLEFNAKDENGMPIYDGRVDITVRPSSYRERKYDPGNIFIPDETWRHSLDMTGKALEEIVLPDSAFVDHAAMYYDIECTFLDAGNEKHRQELSLYRDMRNRLIDFTVNKGILTIRELAGGQSVTAKALLTVYNKEVDIIYRDSVMLPHSMPLMWMADDYEVVTATSADDLWAEDIEDDIMGYRFFRENGNVRLAVDNPAGFPFWYTVRKGKSIVDRGYTSELDRSYRDRGKNAYTMQLSYLSGEDARIIRGSLPYIEKNISMEVNTATTIYPGQTASVDVLVRDRRGKPVRNADITAYAFTSKFGPYSPNMAIFGKSLHGKQSGNQSYDTYENGPYNAKAPMEWSLWKERMGLDSIEYYKFLYPEAYYSYSEKVPGEVTQIAPYVVIDGDVQGVHILWVDEQPHYFHQAQQLNVYSFPITPGFHTLKFRIYDREIVVENVYVEEGMKTILSVNGNNSVVARSSDDDISDKPLGITVIEYDKKNRGILSEREMATLKDHMITVDNTFGTAAFPNDNQSVDLPAMINAGGVYYYLDNTVVHRYDHHSHAYITEPVLAGPFPYRGFTARGKNIGTLYVDTAFVSHFEIEGGYRYGIWNNYLRQTNWGQTPILRDIRPFSPNVSFARNALTASEIRQIFHNRLMGRAEQMSGLLSPAHMDSTDDCRLRLEIGDFADKKTMVSPLLIRLSRSGGDDTVEYFYYGGTRDFDKLPEGDFQIDLIFRDTTRYGLSATLYGNGLNYLKADSIRPTSADSIGRRAFDLLMSRLSVSRQANPLYNYTLYAGQDSVVHVPAQTIGGFDRANYDGEVITGSVRDKAGVPIVGAAVTIEGTGTRTMTDIDGKFALPDAGPGNLLVSYLGFKPLTTQLISGYDYKITLEEDSQVLEEVVVVAYGATTRRALTGSVSTVNADNSLVMLDSAALADKLAGVVAGIQVRGASSVTNGDAPLIIVNGVPYAGALSDLNLDIASLNVMKDASVAAIYGSRAANGVIFIETKDGISLPGLPDAGSGFPEDWNSANALRTNFHDDAFWHPRLSTGRDGSVTFEVTYPDDITSWNANFIAVGGRKQTDKAQLNIRSFKPLNAQLSLPQFALLGDSIDAIGRLTNHLGDTVAVKRSIELQGYTSEEGISLMDSHIDNIPVIVNKSDSIGITYSLAMENGYFDGERRTIPVYKPGIQEAHGEFAVLSDTAVRRIPTDPTLGEVTVHAEASSTQLFLDEIDNIDRYPYLCNEQIASKIKGLLLKKRICSIFGMDFREDNKIDNLIRRLERNKNGDNLWGWWNQDRTELWISKQIVEALLDAEADGYKVDFNKQAATDALIKELNRRLASTGNAGVDNRFVKHELLDVLELLKKLDAKIDYAQYGSLVSSLSDATLNDRLRSMEMALYTADSVRVDSLLSLACETMMGSMYWGEKERTDIEPRYFMAPDINNTNNTLTAYRILRKIGGQSHGKELERIRNWFFEIRKGGSWQNTYESSHIMETIMPDLLKPENGFSDAALILNGNRFEEFPVTETFMAGDTIDVRKEGTVPIFFTAYQQAWNTTPERASEGFSIETAFHENSEPVTVLQAGKSVDLKVSITIDSDAEYVMIEVPIPAGCSYESKGRENPWKETHREYQKEKVAIFCNRLSKGSHDFIIKLLPRYTGLYHLNPAKVELMYYPTFFGRENMGVYEIR